jgi:hypothetical protein
MMNVGGQRKIGNKEMFASALTVAWLASEDSEDVYPGRPQVARAVNAYLLLHCPQHPAAKCNTSYPK